MKKLQHFAFVFGVAIVATAASVPAFAQSASLDFGRGNSVSVGPSGTTFGMNNSTLQINNSGGGSFNTSPDSSLGRTYDLNPAYPAHGMRNVAPPPGAFNEGAYGDQMNAEGASGTMGNRSRRRSSDVSYWDGSQHDYHGDTNGRQTPQVRGGLEQATTAIQGLQDYRYGMTQIPSGRFRYGFGSGGWAPLISPTQMGGFGGGGFLPSTSTGSLDINTCSMPFVRRQ